MAKSKQRLQARELRRQGMSIIKIAATVKIAKSTVSVWCRDIELTERQKLILLSSKEDGLKRGQLIGAEIQKRRRVDKIERYRQEGAGQLTNLTFGECFIAGLALYLAEGSKKRRGIVFTNSDPLIIKFMMGWFVKYFQIPTENLTFYLIINEIHIPREQIVKDYWVNYLNISESQFRKTTFVITKQKKIYENYDRYYGTIHFKILKSTDLLYRIEGLINGLFQSDMVKRDILKSV